jgi:hypothetical protein
MNKIIYHSIIGMLFTAVMAVALYSCSDSWDDHYDQNGTNGNESIYQLVKDNPKLSDFMRVLEATHVYNNNKPTKVTFAQLIAADQALTVWAPLNGSFNADSLLEICKTQKGDSVVAKHFIMNHIAHNLYNMNAQTDENVRMLNDKFLRLTPKALYNANVVENDYNIPAINGLLHVVANDADYTYNIYEGMTTMQEYEHIGKFLKKYEKQELDEERSIQADVVDGRKVYSDSVMITENNLFRVFDKIMEEDSLYGMLVPDRETWNRVYDEAKQYFNFGAIEKADSVSEYWTNVVLIRDLIFNRNTQRSENDSIFTTSYTNRDWPYHVFYNPFQPGGYFDHANITDSLLCSNGYLYFIKEWPFTPKQIYFHPIVVQGEREANMTAYKDCTLNYRQAFGDSISANGYVDIVPRASTSNWSTTFEIRNTLSGTYNIYAVIQPKTVYLANSRDFKPNKFKAVLNYMDVDGVMKSVNFDDEVSNNPYRTDSVLIGQFTFPTCNYQQQETTVSLQLKCSITNRQTNFSREMFLDCIYLKPISEEETKARKEVRR